MGRIFRMERVRTFLTGASCSSTMLFQCSFGSLVIKQTSTSSSSYSVCGSKLFQTKIVKLNAAKELHTNERVEDTHIFRGFTLATGIFIKPICKKTKSSSSRSCAGPSADSFLFLKRSKTAVAAFSTCRVKLI